jgi:HAD superfamily hydrolase (TIGR01549 family)
MKMEQSIIFDFDGVLAESMNIKTEAFAKLFKNFGEEIVKKVTKHHIENGGISRYKKIEKYYKEYVGKKLSKNEISEVANNFSELVIKKVIDAPWVPGAKDFLEKYYKKIDLYVVSGTPQEELDNIIGERKMKKYFKAIYGSPMEKEEIIKKIINENRYDDKKTLFIGDSFSDYTSSKKANVKFIGISKENIFPKKVKVFNDFKELMNHERR